MFTPWISWMGTAVFGASPLKITQRGIHPPLLLSFSLPVSHSPLPRREGCPSDKVDMAEVGLASGALHMEDLLSKFAMICFSLQTLLFSIIDLFCLLSHVRCLWPCFAPQAVEKLPETVWHWIEFSSSWCLQRPFSFCLEMACAVAGGVQSLPTLRHTLQYSNNFFGGWDSLSCMHQVVPSWQALLKLGFVL